MSAEIFIAFAIIFGCFFILKYGADFLMLGAEGIATKLHIPAILVGTVLLAFGTSAPELFVNMLAAYDGHTGFALANVAGSNLANVLLGFGLCALVGGITIVYREFRFQLIFLNLLSLLIFGLMMRYGRIDYWLSGVFIVALIGFIWHGIKYGNSAESDAQQDDAEPELVERLAARLGETSFHHLAYFLLGIVGLYFAGHHIVENAILISQTVGISDEIIGLTIVAVGTSIPDIWVSYRAAMRKKFHYAIGNIIGSNIFNIIVVLTATILVSGQTLFADATVNISFGFALLSIAVVTLHVCFKEQLGKFMGIALLLLYVLAIAVSIWI